MNELLDSFKQDALSFRSDVDWVNNLQQESLDNFLQRGFPTKRDEDWRYTKLDTFLKNKFSSIIETKNIEEYQSDIPDSNEILIQNGKVFPFKNPDNIIIMPLRQAFIEHADKIKKYLDNILLKEHAFQFLNTAMLTNGLFIYVPENTQVEKPIWISNWQTEINQANHLRHLIVAKNNSSITVVEDYKGIENIQYFTNTITEINAGKNALVNHYKIQRESTKSYHIGHVSVAQAASSKVNSHSLSLGGKLVRSDITVNLNEKDSECFLNGIYATDNDQHIDHHTTILHKVAQCRSKQDYKGILSGKSRAVFNGKVIVPEGASKTQAQQQNKNLLLTENAEIDTKPQLEIDSDDVVCTHGATVGNLDEDALFYLQTRGLQKEEATNYLIQAFAAENFANTNEFGNWMKQLLNGVIQDDTNSSRN